jgi:TRAP-type C4-dicarboxylate transport system substrate-binding protein
MYEPVLMSKRAFDRLKKEQQDALVKAGKKSEEFFNQASKKLDDEMVEVFKKNNVVAQDSSYKGFATEVPDGKKLIDEALAVK